MLISDDANFKNVQILRIAVNIVPRLNMPLCDSIVLNRGSATEAHFFYGGFQLETLRHDLSTKIL